MQKIGVVDTVFARVDMGSIAGVPGRGFGRVAQTRAR
jgi:riboflavin synthase